MEIKVLLAKNFGWSLHDINQTDICDLLRFVNRLTGDTKGLTSTGKKRVYCDEVDWL